MGLFRHYWVVFKLLLTLFATIFLLLHMPTVSVLAGVAAEAEGAAGWAATFSAPLAACSCCS